MINDLRIRNIGIIEEVSFNLSSGFTVLTGETGAGKTMILTAFQMICGEKIDNSLIRVNEETAIVEAFIPVKNQDSLINNLNDLEIELDDDGVQISRTISNKTRGKIFLGNRSIPGSVLEELTNEIITIHGQGDQTLLNKQSYQRHLLDQYCGENHLKLLNNYQENYRIFIEKQKQLLELEGKRNQDEKEKLQLQEALLELESANIEIDEENSLNERINLINNSEDIFESLQNSDQILNGGEFNSENSITVLIAKVRKELEIGSKKSERIETLKNIVLELESQIKDFAQQINRDLASLERDPEIIEKLESRRALLKKLLIKYGPTSKDAINRIIEIKSELSNIQDFPKILDQLNNELIELRKNLAKSAEEIHNNRLRFGQKISEEIRIELKHLSMPNASFEVKISNKEEANGLETAGKKYYFDQSGIDGIDFEFSANPGQPLRPINKIASGGEMSRIMLAIELVFSKKDTSRTMIFDEIDAGIGGAAAIEVGKRLKELAKKHQVIVVTHLPQVAAFADSHLKVEKSAKGNVTKASVYELKDEEKLSEIARMMAGMQESSSALEHAKELIGMSKTVSL